MLIKKQQRGFTLIELLVVIAIIAILAAILFPVFSRARDNARKAVCLSNAKQIGTAIMMYVQDWDEHFPVWWTPCWTGPAYAPGSSMTGGNNRPDNKPWWERIYPYVKNGQVFTCPSHTGWAVHQGCGGVVNNTTSCGQRSWQNLGEPLSRISFGYDELIANDYQGRASLARYAHPAETFLLGESMGTQVFGTGLCCPGHPLQGIIRRVATANWDLTPHCCQRGFYIQDVAEAKTRHSGGQVIIFMDGHAKWYHWSKCKDYHFGGTIRMSLWE
jgi:prepilin-type N-terminal cleavage/methylation domain-containing protein